MTIEQAPILVVEDDEHIGQLLHFMLERQGYRVQLLTDGLAASKAIEELPAPPRMILLDVMLPYIDGIAIVSLIRARLGRGAGHPADRQANRAGYCARTGCRSGRLHRQAFSAE